MTVILYSANTTLLQKTKTDSDGKYLFTNLTQGNYTVVVNTTTLPSSSLKNTYQKDGKNDSITKVNLNINQNILDIDFGYYQPPSNNFKNNRIFFLSKFTFKKLLQFFQTDTTSVPKFFTTQIIQESNM